MTSKSKSNSQKWWTLASQSLRDSRWLLLGTGLCVFGFCWLHVLVNAQIDMSLIASLLKRLPKFVENITPVPMSELVTYPVRLALVYEEPLLQVMLLAWCVSRTSDVVAGELGRGTLEVLLSYPIRRSTLLWSSTLVTLGGVVVLAIASFLGTAAGILTSHVAQKTYPFLPPGRTANAPNDRPTSVAIPMSDYVTPMQIAPISLHYACMGVCLVGIGTMVSAIDRYRWRTIGLVIGFYVCQHLLELTGRQLVSVRWLQYGSLLKLYEPARFMADSLRHAGNGWAWTIRNEAGSVSGIGPLACDLAFLSIALVTLSFAAFHFARRDLPAPV